MNPTAVCLSARDHRNHRMDVGHGNIASRISCHLLPVQLFQFYPFEHKGISFMDELMKGGNMPVRGSIIHWNVFKPYRMKKKKNRPAHEKNQPLDISQRLKRLRAENYLKIRNNNGINRKY